MAQTATATWPKATTEEAERQTEGVVARTIEEQTAKLPSDVFLWAALGAVGVSFYLELTGNIEKAHFVGLLGVAVFAARRVQQAGQSGRF